MRKSFFFTKCENKGADQLRSNCAADQRLCIHYKDSTIPLLPKSDFSSLQQSIVTVQPGLCTWSELPKTGFFVTMLKLVSMKVWIQPETRGYEPRPDKA